MGMHLAVPAPAWMQVIDRTLSTASSSFIPPSAHTGGTYLPISQLGHLTFHIPTLVKSALYRQSRGVAGG